MLTDDQKQLEYIARGVGDVLEEHAYAPATLTVKVDELGGLIVVVDNKCGLRTTYPGEDISETDAYTYGRYLGVMFARSYNLETLAAQAAGDSPHPD